MSTNARKHQDYAAGVRAKTRRVVINVNVLPVMNYLLINKAAKVCKKETFSYYSTSLV